MKTLIVIVAVLVICGLAGVADGMSNNNLTKVQSFNVEKSEKLTAYDIQPTVDASYLQSTYNPQ